MLLDFKGYTADVVFENDRKAQAIITLEIWFKEAVHVMAKRESVKCTKVK